MPTPPNAAFQLMSNKELEAIERKSSKRVSNISEVYEVLLTDSIQKYGTNLSSILNMLICGGQICVCFAKLRKNL